MNKLSAGGAFLLCLFLGIIFDQVAIGIIAGLILGAGEATAPKSPPTLSGIAAARSHALEPSPSFGRERAG